MGAATQRTPSRYSPSSVAYPRFLISAQAAASPLAVVIVFLVYAVNGNVLTGLPRYSDDVRGTGVIDKKRAPAFTDRQVRGFIRKRRKTLEVIVRNSRQHVAPIILTGQAPDRGPQDVILARAGMGEETAPLKRIGQTEDTASIDPQYPRQVPKRHGRTRLPDCFENH